MVQNQEEKLAKATSPADALLELKSNRTHLSLSLLFLRCLWNLRHIGNQRFDQIDNTLSCKNEQRKMVHLLENCLCKCRKRGKIRHIPIFQFG